MAWYNNDWKYRFKITSDETKVSYAVGDLYFDLSLAPAHFWDYVKSDGGDIRVCKADGISEVAREVSDFDFSNDAGELFFRATGLSTSVDTDFYIYYGNSGASEPSASSTYGKNQVWATWWNAVWHLQNIGGLGLTDSGLYGLHLTNSGGGADAGKLGGSLSLSGSSQYAYRSHSSLLNPNEVSFSAWINLNGDPTSNGNVMNKNSNAGYRWRVNNTTRKVLFLEANRGLFTSSSAALPTGVWTKIDITGDASSLKIYINGVLDTNSANAWHHDATSGNFVIGADTAYSEWFKGFIDECRIAQVSLSANYIATSFANENDNESFWTVGEHQSLLDKRFSSMFLVF